MSRTDDIPAIVLSLSINGLGVARALGSRGVCVIGAARDASEPGVRSRYIRKVWRYRGGDADLIDLLVSRRRRFSRRPVLFPITDSCVRSIAARWDELKGCYRIGMPDPHVVDSAMSKRGFAEWAKELELPTPRTLFVENLEQVRLAAEQMTYPCIIKPEFQSPRNAKRTALKVHRAENARDLIDSYQSFRQVDPRAVVQEWIPGGDGDVHFCLQYYDAQSRPLVSFCGRKIRQWPPLSGSTASCRPTESAEMERLTTRFFTGIGFRGLCSMEYKRNPDSSELTMVEPTIGRTDWQSAIANINGVPIPYVAYCDLVGLPLPPVPRGPHRVKWVRWSADRASAEQYRKNDRLGLIGWLWSIHPPVRWSVWSASDPQPYLAGLWRRMKHKVRRLMSATIRDSVRPGDDRCG